MNEPPAQNETPHITLVVADDHDIVRAGMVALLAAMPGIRVLGQARDGEELLGVLACWNPDIVLCDIRMPRMDGLKALQHIRSQHPGVRVVMLSMHDSAAYVRRAVHSGASGYLLKDAAPVELEHALRTVASTGSYFSNGVTQTLLAPDEPEPAGRLTQRQLQILKLTAEGRTPKQIGHHLGLSTNTVNVHRSRIMGVLGMRDVASLTRYALRQGLVDDAG